MKLEKIIKQIIIRSAQIEMGQSAISAFSRHKQIRRVWSEMSSCRSTVKYKKRIKKKKIKKLKNFC
jgi:hypothetical protein